ncbi:MAG: hypothetical protein RPU64_15090 [Candidatus Sedimenticola sp. (ex Thyasira tokunagai)]
MRPLLALWLLAILLLTGCMSLQEIRDRRITNEQEVFNSFPADVQANIRQGQIDIGYNQSMVQLAWGAPSQVMTRRVKGKVTKIWIYTKTLSHPNFERLSVPVSYVDGEGKVQIVYRRVWSDRTTYEEVNMARVEFTHGRVSAIEQITP